DRAADDRRAGADADRAAHAHQSPDRDPGDVAGPRAAADDRARRALRHLRRPGRIRAARRRRDPDPLRGAPRPAPASVVAQLLRRPAAEAEVERALENLEFGIWNDDEFLQAVSNSLRAGARGRAPARARSARP